MIMNHYHNFHGNLLNYKTEASHGNHLLLIQPVIFSSKGETLGDA